MQATVQLTPQDWAENASYLWFHTPWGKAKMRRRRLVFGVGGLLLIAFGLASFPEQSMGGMLSAGLGVAALLFISPLNAYFYRRNARRMFENVKDLSFFAPTVVEISEEGLRTTDAVSDSFLKWTAVNHVCVYKGLFIFTWATCAA